MKGAVRDWAFVRRVTEPALVLAPRDYLDTIRGTSRLRGSPEAVAERNTPWLFNWLVDTRRPRRQIGWEKSKRREESTSLKVSVTF